MNERDFPKINLISPVLWFRYFVRFFASFIPPSFLKNFFYRITGIKIGRNVFIGESVYFIDGFKGGLIDLKDGAVLSPKVVVVAMAVPAESFIGKKYYVTKTAKVTIGEGSWIGVGAVVLPSVVIGDGSIIGANAVVNGPVRSLEVWAGVPAKYIKKVEDYGLRDKN